MGLMISICICVCLFFAILTFLIIKAIDEIAPTSSVELLYVIAIFFMIIQMVNTVAMVAILF